MTKKAIWLGFIHCCILPVLCNALIGQVALALDPPSISRPNGTYSGQLGTSFTMSGPAGANVYYTIDGTQPSNSSILYTSGTVNVTQPTAVNAVSFDGTTYSTVTSRFFDASTSLSVIALSSLALRLRAGLGVPPALGNPRPVGLWADLSNSSPPHDGAATSGHEPTVLSGSGITTTVLFDGNRFLSLPSGFANFANGLTIFAVVAPKTMADSTLLDLGQGTLGNDIVLRLSQSDGLAKFDTYSGSTPSTAASGAPVVLDSPQILEVTLSPGSPATGTVLINGIAGASNPSMFAPANVARTVNYIGQTKDGLGNKFTGRILELLIYSTQLSSVQRALIRNYLTSYYDIDRMPPPMLAFYPPGGTLAGPAQITIAPSRGCSIIRYTTDGSTVNENSPIYRAPIWVGFSQTIRAVSFIDGFPGPQSQASYTLDPVLFPAPSRTDTTPPVVQFTLPTATQ